MTCCIITVIVYFGLMFLGYGIEVVKVVVSAAFVTVLCIGGWIGWTMASTPAPEPVEILTSTSWRRNSVNRRYWMKLRARI